MIEIPVPEALNAISDYPFKGNIDVGKLEELLSKMKGRIAYVRVEAVANLLGGQPVSMKNISLVKELCDEYAVPLVPDASMVDWNAYFTKEREMAGYAYILYMSARKAPAVRGGLIATNNREFYEKLSSITSSLRGVPLIWRDVC